MKFLFTEIQVLNLLIISQERDHKETF